MQPDPPEMSCPKIQKSRYKSQTTRPSGAQTGGVDQRTTVVLTDPATTLPL